MWGDVSSSKMRSQICKSTTHLESVEIRERFVSSLRKSIDFSRIYIEFIFTRRDFNSTSDITA